MTKIFPSKTHEFKTCCGDLMCQKIKIVNKKNVMCTSHFLGYHVDTHLSLDEV